MGCVIRESPTGIGPCPSCDGKVLSTDRPDHRPLSSNEVRSRNEGAKHGRVRAKRTMDWTSLEGIIHIFRTKLRQTPCRPSLCMCRECLGPAQLNVPPYGGLSDQVRFLEDTAPSVALRSLSVCCRLRFAQILTRCHAMGRGLRSVSAEHRMCLRFAHRMCTVFLRKHSIGAHTTVLLCEAWYRPAGS